MMKRVKKKIRIISRSHSRQFASTHMTKKILFSGIQPTGNLHLGNYLGAIKQWVELQKKFKAIFCVVDYHSLTEDFEPREKPAQILNTAATYLACGLDPKKSIIFVQSHVAEHTELAWIFNCLMPMAELERMTQYKDKVKKQKHNVNVGLFDYPILMAADILLYQAEAVPVGEDQVQHIELARTVARKFNSRFGKFFPEPKELLTQAKKIMSLTEPDKKMSKSDQEKSFISLADTPEAIRAKIKSATTDPGKHIGAFSGGANLLNLFSFFSLNKKLVEKFRADYKNGKLKYSELKPALAEAIIKTLKPIQARKKKLLTNKGYLAKVLKDGAERAHEIASGNLKEIKEKIGLI